ncbi:hypothetical protein BXZ70DRAFT_107823 [Cristinia sonorae]|uniref:Uncharacterized protein n=1 Tax=Cristinia sonorae TaxID=1940300 RepID=A0A8K0XQC9_9AGAR|nr:hypothetical protein BXZ70DRAFT_107823 [Cristinia sonorae]
MVCVQLIVPSKLSSKQSRKARKRLFKRAFEEKILEKKKEEIQSRRKVQFARYSDGELWIIEGGLQRRARPDELPEEGDEITYKEDNVATEVATPVDPTNASALPRQNIPAAATTAPAVLSKPVDFDSLTSRLQNLAFEEGDQQQGSDDGIEEEERHRDEEGSQMETEKPRVVQTQPLASPPPRPPRSPLRPRSLSPPPTSTHHQLQPQTLPPAATPFASSTRVLRPFPPIQPLTSQGVPNIKDRPSTPPAPESDLFHPPPTFPTQPKPQPFPPQPFSSSSRESSEGWMQNVSSAFSPQLPPIVINPPQAEAQQAAIPVTQHGFGTPPSNVQLFSQLASSQPSPPSPPFQPPTPTLNAPSRSFTQNHSFSTPPPNISSFSQLASVSRHSTFQSSQPPSPSPSVPLPRWQPTASAFATQSFSASSSNAPSFSQPTPWQQSSLPPAFNPPTPQSFVQQHQQHGPPASSAPFGTPLPQGTWNTQTTAPTPVPPPPPPALLPQQQHRTWPVVQYTPFRELLRSLLKVRIHQKLPKKLLANDPQPHHNLTHLDHYRRHYHHRTRDVVPSKSRHHYTTLAISGRKRLRALLRSARRVTRSTAQGYLISAHGRLLARMRWEKSWKETVQETMKEGLWRRTGKRPYQGAVVQRTKFFCAIAMVGSIQQSCTAAQPSVQPIQTITSTDWYVTRPANSVIFAPLYPTLLAVEPQPVSNSSYPSPVSLDEAALETLADRLSERLLAKLDEQRLAALGEQPGRDLSKVDRKGKGRATVEDLEEEESTNNTPPCYRTPLSRPAAPIQPSMAPSSSTSSFSDTPSPSWSDRRLPSISSRTDISSTELLALKVPRRTVHWAPPHWLSQLSSRRTVYGGGIPIKRTPKRYTKEEDEEIIAKFRRPMPPPIKLPRDVAPDTSSTYTPSEYSSDSTSQYSESSTESEYIPPPPPRRVPGHFPLRRPLRTQRTRSSLCEDLFPTVGILGLGTLVAFSLSHR